MTLAMLCPECSGDAAEDDDDDDDDAADAPSYAEFADRFVRMSAAEQGAFLWQLESDCADGLDPQDAPPGLASTEATAEDASANSVLRSPMFKRSVYSAKPISTNCFIDIAHKNITRISSK